MGLVTLFRITLSIVLIVLVGTSMAAPARAQTAGEISSDRDLQKAYDEAFAAMMADPQNLDKTFAFASLASQKGDLEGAISALERMLFINPDLPRVKLELGVLYFRLNSLETARVYLQGALAAPEVPPPVRERAQSFLDEIDKRAARHQLTGSLYGGVRVQSNANASGSGAVTFFDPVLGPQNATLTTGTKQGDFNLFALANARYIYDFQDQNQDLFEVTGAFYSARQQTVQRVNVTFAELTFGPRLGVPWLSGTNVRPYAILDYIDLKDDPYYRAPGAGLELLSEVVPGTIAQINFEARDKRYHNSFLLPTLTDQNGDELLVRGQLTQVITDALAALASGTIATLHARNESQGYLYYDYTLGLSYSFDAPFGLTELPWNILGTATRAFYDYNRPDPTIDANTTRFDRDWRFALVSTVPVTVDWSVITTLGRTIRQSSIQNYVYNNSYASIGASWRF